MARIIYDTSEVTRAREIARLREKALHDEASAIKDATDKGFAKGREEGRAEERNSAIQRMRECGFTEEQIREIFSDLK